MPAFPYHVDARFAAQRRPSPLLALAMSALMSGLFACPLLQAESAEDLINAMRALRNRDWSSPSNSGGEIEREDPSVTEARAARRESRAQAAKVNALMDLAKQANARGDHAERLRLFREALPMAQDPAFKAELNAAITGEQGWAAVTQAEAVFDAGDDRAALALYRQAQTDYPGCMTDEGKKWVTDLATRLELEDRQREQTKTTVAGMQRSIHDLSRGLAAAPVTGDLEFSGAGSAVVDARGVPANLDGSIAKAVAAAYRGAPDGVADRVRKGFQAVMRHDWKVAKAWFEDAANHDPGNAGLKRFVALASDPNLQLPEDGDVKFLFPFLEDLAKAVPASATRAQLQLPLPEDDVSIMLPALATPDRGERAHELQVPQDADQELLFTPSPTSATPVPSTDGHH